jgi:signal transduction histidine kinase/heme-degrading monooxygenase HmoA
MVLAISRFRVVNRMEEEVAAAFRNRPHLVDRASGFLGLEVLRDRNDLGIFYLVTRWSDEKSFREWHGSEAHHRSHDGIPAGLRLDSSFTEVVALERLEEPDGAPQRIADLGLLLAPFLEQARGTLLLCCAADGTILGCNPAAGDLLGPALVGLPLWDHLTGPDAERLRARIAAAQRRPEERFRLNVCDPSHVVRTFECQVDLRPDGFVLVGERDFSSIERLHGEWLALNNELTLMARERGQALARAQRAEREHERLLASEQQARAEAEEANRRKDDILAMVSHDLRTPLGAILGWSRLLASGRLGKDEATRAVETIQRNAEIQASLVEDLLDLARAKAGKLRFNPRPTDPVKAVESILEAARPAAEAKGVSLERVVIGGSMLLLLADPARLEQALGNLVANAVKFTPAGGRVEVRLDEEEDGVAIRVEDTGEGIDPALLPHIFDRFRQGQGVGTERMSGLGLGLAIARDLIELQGGTIEAASNGPGRGTIFTVRLPRPPRHS